MFKLFSSKPKIIDFPENAEWLNTDKQLSLRSNLKGHVIVLDFWTYCCINCIHMLAELKNLEEKYKDNQVIFIGIHSSKFTNENNKRNIQSAIERYEITHPVVIDKDHALWSRYEIAGWPTIVVLDTKGNVVYKQSGEGQSQSLDAVIEATLQKEKSEKNLSLLKIDLNQKPLQKKTTLSFPSKIEYSEVFSQLFIVDSNHNRILATQLEDTKSYLVQQIGSGEVGFEDGSFEKAKFNHPQGIARKRDILYIADTGNHTIRLVDLKQKTVKTIAGNGQQARGSPKRGKGLEIALNSPWDVLIHQSSLFIAMAGSHQIYKLDLMTHEIEPYAGTGGEGIKDGLRNTALFAQPSGLDSDGEFLYVADSETSSIRAINFKTGYVSTLIGKGLFEFGNKEGRFEETLLQHCIGIHYNEGLLYIADTYNNSIKGVYLNSDKVIKFIGTDENNPKVCMINEGKMVSCNELPLYEPNDVIVVKNKLFIADTNNHLIRIFDMNKKTLKDLQII